MLDTLLQWDIDALHFARTLVWEEYAFLVQIAGELIVVWVAVFLVVLWLSGVKQKDVVRKEKSVHIAVFMLLVFGIYAFVNLFLPQFRPGPDEVIEGIRPLIPHPIGNSFPSWHALFSVVFFVGLAYYFPNRYFMGISLLIALITCVARVIGWVHYVGDIVGGFLVGILGAYLLRIPAERITKFLMPYLLKMASWFWL